jgi:hypothetical protein
MATTRSRSHLPGSAEASDVTKSMMTIVVLDHLLEQAETVFPCMPTLAKTASTVAGCVSSRSEPPSASWAETPGPRRPRRRRHPCQSIVASRSGTVATPKQPRRARAMAPARAQDVRRGPVGTVDEVFQVVGRAASEQSGNACTDSGRCSAFAISGTYMKKTPFNPNPDRCANAAALKKCP